MSDTRKLDTSLVCINASLVGPGLCVVQHSVANQCALPGAQNAANVMGVTLNEQQSTNGIVHIRRFGLVQVKAASAIALGDHVRVAGTSGKVETSSGEAQNVLGFAESAAAADGDLITIFLNPQIANVAAESVSAISPLAWRTWDAMTTTLPATAANDDLGVATSTTFGTDAISIQAGDFGGASITRYARALITIPRDYVAGADISLRFKAGMITTVADTSCTIDAAAYLYTAGAGSAALDGSPTDLVETAAQSINSLTFANKDFVLTPDNLTPGAIIDVRVAIAGVDSGDAGTMIPEITHASLVY